MKRILDAKIIDIKIVNVPFSWKGKVHINETTDENNFDRIDMLHEPSGTTYSLSVDGKIEDKRAIAEARARAKLNFIHHLHGDEWILDED